MFCWMLLLRNGLYHAICVCLIKGGGCSIHFWSIESDFLLYPNIIILNKCEKHQNKKQKSIPPTQQSMVLLINSCSWCTFFVLHTFRTMLFTTRFHFDFFFHFKDEYCFIGPIWEWALLSSNRDTYSHLIETINKVILNCSFFHIRTNNTKSV